MGLTATVGFAAGFVATVGLVSTLVFSSMSPDGLGLVSAIVTEHNIYDNCMHFVNLNLHYSCIISRINSNSKDASSGTRKSVT